MLLLGAGVTARGGVGCESIAVISSVMPRSALHFSAMALRFDTPVPNWRSVMFDCAQMVGKPVIAPLPAARPANAAVPFNIVRRDTPFFFISVISYSPWLAAGPLARCGELVNVGGVPTDRRRFADRKGPLEEGSFGNERGEFETARRLQRHRNCGALVFDL